MHPCLLVPEILDMIIQTVDADNEPGSGDMMAIVKTCRAFHEPGLKLLWRKIPNLIPLLMALPADLWQIRLEPGMRINMLKFTREPTPEDWEVFDRYASRVRTLGFLPDRQWIPMPDTESARLRFINRCAVHIPLFEILANHRRPLLPNLSVLMLCATLYRLFPFFSTSLTKVSLPIDPLNGDEVSRLLIELPSRSPNIQKLNIDYVSRMMPISDALINKATECVSQMICELSHIEEFYCKDFVISQDAFRHLSSLPSLHSLEITANSLCHMPYREYPAPLGRFSLLSPLGFRVDVYTKFIDFLEPSTLHMVDIQIGTNPLTSDHLQLIVSSLTKRFRRDKDLSLKILHVCHQLPVDDIVTFSVIEPLLSFSKFTELSLCANLVDLSDSELLQLVKAMPKLRILHLGCGCSRSGRAKMALEGLLYVASFCHDIEAASIFIHGIFDRVVPQEEINNAKSEHLVSLDVGFSTLGLPAEEVADFLRAVFPNIMMLNAQDADGGWKEVAYIIRPRSRLSSLAP